MSSSNPSCPTLPTAHLRSCSTFESNVGRREYHVGTRIRKAAKRARINRRGRFDIRWRKRVGAMPSRWWDGDKGGRLRSTLLDYEPHPTLLLLLAILSHELGILRQLSRKGSFCAKLERQVRTSTPQSSLDLKPFINRSADTPFSPHLGSRSSWNLTHTSLKHLGKR